MSQMTIDDKPNNANKNQEGVRLSSGHDSTVTRRSEKRKMGDTFDNRQLRKRRRSSHPKQLSVSLPYSLGPKEPYWHAAGITRTELQPKYAKRTYIYLNEQNYTVGTKQLQELRLMFQKHIGNGFIKADRWGYYILFDQGQEALKTARKCFENFRFQRFEDKITPMMLFHEGECIIRCHLHEDEFDDENFVWVGDALLKSLG